MCCVCSVSACYWPSPVLEGFLTGMESTDEATLRLVREGATFGHRSRGDPALARHDMLSLATSVVGFDDGSDRDRGSGSTKSAISCSATNRVINAPTLEAFWALRGMGKRRRWGEPRRVCPCASKATELTPPLEPRLRRRQFPL